jgi:uncharacterized protein
MKGFRYLTIFTLIGFVCAESVFAYVSPGKPVGMVNDFAAILTPTQKAVLENKVGNFARPAGIQMAVVTIPTLGGDSIENYATQLFTEWGIGQKIKDNGILILVAPNERQVRIEVGYGLEPTVTDAMSSVIIRTIIIPAFKTGDYYSGINAGTDKIIGLIEGDPETARFIDQNSGSFQNPVTSFPYLPVIVFIILIAMLSRRGGRKILFYMFLNGMFRNNGGSDRGGGFGGFGGGRSGGGGASGSW